MKTAITLALLAREAKQAQSTDTPHRGEEFRAWVADNAGEIAELLGLSASDMRVVLALEIADCERPHSFQDANIGKAFALAVERIRNLLRAADDDAQTFVRANLADEVAESYDHQSGEVDANAVRALLRGSFDGDRIAFERNGETVLASAGRLREILSVRRDARVFIALDAVLVQWGNRGWMRLATKSKTGSGPKRASGTVFAHVALSNSRSTVAA